MVRQHIDLADNQVLCERQLLASYRLIITSTPLMPDNIPHILHIPFPTPLPLLPPHFILPPPPPPPDQTSPAALADQATLFP